MPYLLVLGGIALLYGGGEALVAGARNLARLLGLSPLVVGLTVVAFATSTPELAATLAAVLKGTPQVGLGNVVGSNIANLGLILGIAALIHPLRTTAGFLSREMPFLIGGSLLTVLLAWDGSIGRLAGGALVALMGVYLVALLRAPAEPEVREEFAAHYGAPPERRWSLARNVALIVAGVALLALGAHLLVTGAVELARRVGASDRIIGLTLVALGTSLPEMASTLVAALRREAEITLGNLIGSNIFNMLFVLGGTALVRPVVTPASAGARIDLVVMLAVALLAWPLLVTGRRLQRREGVLLLAAYGGYIGWLFLA